MNITKKMLNVIIAVLVVSVAGVSVGYSINSGVIYLGPPIPGFNVTGNGTTDAGIPVYLSVTLDKSPSSKLYYVWFANGKAGYGSHFETSFSSPGTYNISLKISMSDNHTSVKRIIKETVNPVPTITISENKNVIDAGQKITFTSTVRGGTGSYSYSWSYNPGASGPDPTAELFTDFGGITATVTDSVGGSSTSNTLDPTINAGPLVLATSNTSYTDIGSPVSFSASTSFGTSPFTYSWTWNGQVISTSQAFSYSFSQTGTQTVYCTVTDKLGVTDSDYIVVNVYNDPTLSLSLSPQSPQIGNVVQVLANTNHGFGTFDFQWYLNGVSVNAYAAFNALYYTFNSSGTYTVEVTATDQAGMSASSQITFYVS